MYTVIQGKIDEGKTAYVQIEDTEYEIDTFQQLDYDEGGVPSGAADTYFRIEANTGEVFLIDEIERVWFRIE
jgi:hypothetical protein